MAQATARCFATEGEPLLLAARNQEALPHLKDDLLVRGAKQVDLLPAFDASSPEGLSDLLNALEEVKPDRVLIAVGMLPEPEDCEVDAEKASLALQVNFDSVVRMLTPLANKMAEWEGGTLAVISSVAGLRGRQSNYHYGAAKGGLNIFLQGLRNRLHPHGVRVLTILPGFVDTPMTADLDQGPLYIPAETAGKIIHKAMTKGKGDVVYVPWFWWAIMLIIRMIPEPIFKRLKL